MLTLLNASSFGKTKCLKTKAFSVIKQHTLVHSLAEDLHPTVIRNRSQSIIGGVETFENGVDIKPMTYHNPKLLQFVNELVVLLKFKLKHLKLICHH